MTKLILDSNYLCHRAKHSTGNLTHEEKSVGVIFGFLNTIKTLALKFNTSQFIFCWDSQKSFRREIYIAYKESRREKTKEERAEDAIAYPQFAELRMKILSKLGFKNIFIKTGFEADDIIASLVSDSRVVGEKVVVSSDDDLLQLLEWCKIYNPKTKVITNEKEFFKQYRIESKQWPMVKSLAGCSSDNVEGIDGVGEVKAIQYILGELPNGKVLERIKDELTEILDCNLPLVGLPFKGTGKFVLNDKEVFCLDDFLDICEEYNFQSFLKQDEFKVWKRIFNMR